ncbi:hypothetical protein UFOVP652_52 [uncultured Caudovirales phage]|uniref:Uncharacterized protein n=1 Tax=uncultured Caudovirales phage TaxID=2100421 RepID=A0A6J7X546_9CAUD|nr:hypothetical protein UFOVP652_52 [uncultured Caudovirales phage]CAB5224420.1 hypothetical protein UFOVP734_72 [uncultured Caudovirales phage]
MDGSAATVARIWPPSSACADLVDLVTEPATWRAFLFVDLVEFFRLKFNLPGHGGRG